MLIGQDFKRLEQRICNALCGGTLRGREAEFLQNISRKITLFGERALLSDKQASWLFTILTSVESKERSRTQIG